MIIWLNKIPRLNSVAKHLHRIGDLPAKDYPIHRSFDHIAFSILTGDVCVSLHDQNVNTTVNQPSCVLALPGDVRKLTPLRPVNEFFFVYEADAMPALLPENQDIFHWQSEKIIPLKKCPMVLEYAESMKKILNAPLNPPRCSQLDYLAEAIMMESFLNPQNISPHSGNQIVNEVENYIHRHYHESLDWEKIAFNHGISYPRLRQLWANEYSISPHSYVMELRNREACELLKDHSLPVARISELIGYDDPRYFSRFFQRKNNMTPTEYRNMYK